MNEEILIIILIVCLLISLINYCKMDESVTRLETLIKRIKRLESETIALQKKIENKDGDSE